MKEFFYLKGKDQNGPFSLEELVTKDISDETLIWREGMENCQKLKDIPELTQVLRPVAVPPPLPKETEEENIKTEISGQIKVTTQESSINILKYTKRQKKLLSWLIVWCCFHLFALLMSYSQIKIFNDNGKPSSREFWPFVEFKTTNRLYDPNGYYHDIKSSNRDWMEETNYNGIFTDYDWTEFAAYVGGALAVIILILISNKKE